MTRISLIAFGAFAIMASAICLLILIPQAMLSQVEAPPALPRTTSAATR